MIQKTKKPADAATSSGLQIEQVSTTLNLSNNPKPAKPQAPPLLADTAGEDDWTYFRQRPGATTRTRLPFLNEYPDDFMEYGGGVAFVRITVERDQQGEPTRGARSLTFCEGGSA
jgi:hypothetical protein